MTNTLTTVSTGKWYFIADLHHEDGYYDIRPDLVGQKFKFDSLNTMRQPMYDVQSPNGNKLIDCYYLAGRGKLADGSQLFFMGVALTEEYPDIFVKQFADKQESQQNPKYEW